MMQICIQPPGKSTPIPVSNVPVSAQNVSIPTSYPSQQQPQQYAPPQQYMVPQQPQQQYMMPQQQYMMPQQQPPQQQAAPPQQTTPSKPAPSYIATRSPLNPVDLGPSSLYTSTITSSQLGYPSDVSQYYAQQ